MYVVSSDFSGDIKISTSDLIPGFEDIIKRSETKFLKMILGGRQFSEMRAALANEQSENYDKWNKFLRGTTYTHSNIEIEYEGAIQFLRYFSFVDIMKEQTFTAASEIYSREVTNARPLSGIERQQELNRKYNEGVRYYRRSYFFMNDNGEYNFDTGYYNRLNFKNVFTGIRL